MRGKSFALLCLAIGPTLLNPVAQAATELGLQYLSGSPASALETFQLEPNGVPQRVDYRDRADAFDLELLGVATGMCSLAGECDVCAYRVANPCQVADRFGADTALCQLPSLLGGNVTSAELCGGGATVDVILKPSADDSYADSAALGGSSSSSSSSLPSLVAATLTAFRTRAGALVLTVTARCGWLLVPYNSTADDLPGSTLAAVAEPDAVILEGTLSYGGMDIHFAAPAAQQQQQLGGGGGRARYSCYSAVLPLRGLSSSCQSMEVDVAVRVAVHAVALLPTSAAEAEAEAGYAGADADDSAEAVTCEEVSPVLAAEASFTMRPPQAARRVYAAEQAASEAQAGLAAEADQQQQSRQRLFSNGVAVRASYLASLDPRTPETAAWLDSLGCQFPVVAATQMHQSLSFLVGTLAGEVAGADVELAAARAVSPGSDPLFPSGASLEACDRQSIDVVASAVVSALGSQGVTEQHVAAVTCLKAPYTEVPYTELPPCAGGALVLFNVSLEVPLGGSSCVGNVGSTTVPADPRVFAETLVRSHMAAPWSCLSTEGQMRMATVVQLDVQLPKGPGLQAVEMGSIPQQPPTATLLPAPSAGRRSPPHGTSAAGGDGGGGNSSGAAAAAPTSSGGLSLSAVVAVSVAVAVAVFAIPVAIFAVRAVRQAKAEAHAAAAAAGAGAAAGPFGFGGGAAAALPHPLHKLSTPAVKSSKQSATMAPPPLGAMASYMSSVDGEKPPFPSAAMQMSHQEWLRQGQQQQQHAAGPEGTYLRRATADADATGCAATCREPSAADVPLVAYAHQQGAIHWAGIGVCAGGFGEEAAGGAAAHSATTDARDVGRRVGAAHAEAAAAAAAAAAVALDSSGTTDGGAWAAASGGSSSTYDSRAALSPSSSQTSLAEDAGVRDRSDEADSTQRRQKGKRDTEPDADDGSAFSGGGTGGASMGARRTALRPCTPPSGSTSPASSRWAPDRVSAVVAGPGSTDRPVPMSPAGRLGASRTTLSRSRSGGGYSAASSSSSSRRHDGDADEGDSVKFGCTGVGRPLGRTGRFLHTVARALGSGGHQRQAQMAGMSAVAVAASRATLWSNVLYDSQLRNRQHCCEINGSGAAGVETAAQWAGRASIGVGPAASCDQVPLAVDSDADGSDGEGGCNSLVTAGAGVGVAGGPVRETGAD